MIIMIVCLLWATELLDIYVGLLHPYINFGYLHGSLTPTQKFWISPQVSYTHSKILDISTGLLYPHRNFGYLHGSLTPIQKFWISPRVSMSRPNSRSDPNRVRGARLYTGTLYLYFFYNRIKISYTTYKRTTIGVVSVKIYTHILSPIYIYKNCTFTFTNQCAEPTCSEPLLVCWSSSIRKVSDVFSCTYTN